MSTEVTTLPGRTVHLTSAGGQYEGRFTIIDAYRRGDSIQITGTYHAPSGPTPRTMTVRPWCIHDTHAAAVDAGIRTRAAIRERRTSADEARELRITKARAAHRVTAR